jgi:hypothetical protein
LGAVIIIRAHHRRVEAAAEAISSTQRTAEAFAALAAGRFLRGRFLGEFFLTHSTQLCLM